MRLYGVCKTGALGALACGRGHRFRWYQRLWPRRGKPPMSLFSPTFLVILSTRWASSKYMLSLCLNQTARLALVRARLFHV